MVMSRVEGRCIKNGSKTYARVPEDRLSYTDKGNILQEAQRGKTKARSRKAKRI